MPVVRHSARQADDRHGRHRPPDPRGPVGPARHLPARVQYKKTGILFLDLAPAAAVQGSLFLRTDTPERVRLMALVDELNARYGRDRVRFAVAG